MFQSERQDNVMPELLVLYLSRAEKPVLATSIGSPLFFFPPGKNAHPKTRENIDSYIDYAKNYAFQNKITTRAWFWRRLLTRQRFWGRRKGYLPRTTTNIIKNITSSYTILLLLPIHLWQLPRTCWKLEYRTVSTAVLLLWLLGFRSLQPFKLICSV